MLLDVDDAQLLLLSWQTDLLTQLAEADAVLKQAQRLARIAALLGVPVWAVAHERFGAFDAPLRSGAARTLEAASFNACEDGLLNLLMPPAKAPSGNARSLPKQLQRPAAEPPDVRQQIILTGCEAHIGVLQTALGLLDAEALEVWVVTDACSARSLRDRDAAYDRLAGAGVELVTAEMVAFEWLGSSRHPAYEKVLALLR